MTNRFSHTSVEDCRIIRLRHFPHIQGTLTAVQNSDEIPFAIKRIYYIYDIPTDAERGGHSHHNEQRLLIAASGCFDVNISDGINWKTFTLKRPFEALYIPPGLWRTLTNFSSGAIVLALSSTKFDENDYVRDYDRFVELKKASVNE